MSEPTWNGLAFSRCLELWDSGGWRDAVAEALYDVAYSERASLDDRCEALNLLAIATQNDMLAPDPSYHELTRDILIAEARGGARPGSKKQRKKLRRRLRAAKAMLSTAMPWFQHAAAVAHAEEAAQKTAENPPPEGPN